MNRRMAVLGLIVAFVAAPIPAQGAEEPEVRARLAALEQSILALETELDELGERLEELAAERAGHETRAADLRRDLRKSEVRHARAELFLSDARARLAHRAREVYVRGPLRWFDLLLSSRSFRDAFFWTAEASRTLSEDASVLRDAERAEARLDAARATKTEVAMDSGVALARARTRHREMVNAFTELHRRVQELALQRAEALALIARAPGDLSGILRAAGRGMTITYEQWAGDFLTALGAPVSRDNVLALVAWQTAEHTKATWNPLATTLHLPGATVFNDHGVRNFVSKEQGVEASIATLARPGHGYEAIVAALRRGAPALETAGAINASDWCRGCAGGTYVIGLVDAVADVLG